MWLFQFLHILTYICYLSIFCIVAILLGVKWYHRVVLICVSLMTKDIEHLFMLLAICIYSLEKCLFRTFAHFLIGLFVLLLSCKSSSYVRTLHKKEFIILDTSPVSDDLQLFSPHLWVIFPLPGWCPFTSTHFFPYTLLGPHSFIFFFPLTFIYLFSCTRSSRGIFSLHCSMWALWLWHMGSSSQVQIEPRPPKLGVCIPSHWTTKEVLGLLLFWSYSSFSPAHLGLQELPLPCSVDSVPGRFSPSQQSQLYPDCGCPGFEGSVLVRQVLPTAPQCESDRVERPTVR